MTDDVYAELDDQPSPPENVRIHYMDGSEDPVELTYEGLGTDGLHHWLATPTSPLLSVYATLKCDMLPPRTSLHLHSQATPPSR
jgi:hypothetical protein